MPDVYLLSVQRTNRVAHAQPKHLIDVMAVHEGPLGQILQMKFSFAQHSGDEMAFAELVL
jgi:hypothetical protein